FEQARLQLSRQPRALPRMNFEQGIPDECRTIVVVPTLLTGHRRIASLIEGLELRYLANRDPNLWFALLTDFCDAEKEHVEGDDDLLAQAVHGIEELNEKYRNGVPGRFFLCHRPRLYNSREGCWMGRERKRGKLEDFNALLYGDDRASFNRIVGDESQFPSIHYVITLDTDTNLPWGAGWRLVGAAAHPLNRPLLDRGGRRVVRGYAILQPRVGISLRSAGQSLYSRLLAGEVGIDPYTRVVSDLYQDLFAETSFIGKGIYDVDAFRQLLDGRFPDNAVLSHDLLESCYARSAQCSDVELLEDSPSGYLADVSRRHRWMRGDWQIAPWLGLRVRNSTGQRVHPALAALGWWKIFDNLRRALVAPAFTALLVLGWIFLPAPCGWTLSVLALPFVPELLPGLVELAHRPSKLPLSLHGIVVARSTVRRLARVALWLTFLPFEAGVALDAALRSFWRMLFSRRRLLEWQTAAAVERGGAAGIGGVLGRMWAGPVLAVGMAGLWIGTGAYAAVVPAGPVLFLWGVSPWVAWWVSRPLWTGRPKLGENDVGFLRRIARLTWRYFEVFVGPQENWLPPDNFQEQPSHRIAHRTSPTDMGLALLANLSAYDLGYLSGGQLLDRLAHTIESMEQLERYRGHFLNWYDTATRKPLRPSYVSTVDSGNLVGYARVLRIGLRELPAAPVLPSGMLAGLTDTLGILRDQLGRGIGLDQIERLMQNPAGSLSERVAWLRQLATAAAGLASAGDFPQMSEAAWWASAFERQVLSFLADLDELAPWLTLQRGDSAGREPHWVADLDRAGSLQELGDLARQAAVETATSAGGDGAAPWGEAFSRG
ncbi:MAG TPA: cyclic beta 1-2 glucan synthetase, partial [Candidatus Aminicenantes bacterium]|nr:cyclic beta 1-2 glucan synthetase [Candidatus Aminicenantes bacterium]